MSRIVSCLEKAQKGLGYYLSANKLMVLFFAVLLAFWLIDQKKINKKQNRFLVYSLLMTMILIIPPTAVAVLLYQTSYFDYAWAWSMVPVTCVIAFGVVMLWEQGIPQKKKICLFGVMVVILCICGNYGILGKISSDERVSRSETEKILVQIHELTPEKDSILWGPAQIMQEVRRQEGSVLVIYGRDMWDGKAGSYDYEAYSTELTEAYIWLEEVMADYYLGTGLVKPEEVFGFLEDKYFKTREAEKHIEAVLEAGANTIVWPNLISRQAEEILESFVADRNKTMEIAYTEEYAVYVIH